MAEQKKSMRFNPHLDTLLLREVLTEKPFINKAKWSDVSSNFNAALEEIGEPGSTTPRTVKERVQLIMDKFKKDEMDSLKKSGTDEQYREREALLTELISLVEEYEKEKMADKKKTTVQSAVEKKQEVEKGALIRDSAMKSLSEKSTENASAFTPKGKGQGRKRQVDKYLSVIQARDESNKKLREDEIQLRKEELALEREKLALEKAKNERDAEKDRLLMEILLKAVNK